MLDQANVAKALGRSELVPAEIIELHTDRVLCRPVVEQHENPSLRWGEAEKRSGHQNRHIKWSMAVPFGVRRTHCTDRHPV